MRSQRVSKLRQLQCFLGLLNCACYVVPRGGLTLSPPVDILSPVLEKLMPGTGDSLLGFESHGMVARSHRKCHGTNALSCSGWGAHLDQVTLTSTRRHQRCWHSNKEEMYAVLSVIKAQGRTLGNSHVLLQSDSRCDRAH
jgi:hypothetical protein